MVVKYTCRMWNFGTLGPFQCDRDEILQLLKNEEFAKNYMWLKVQTPDGREFMKLPHKKFFEIKERKQEVFNW